MIIVQIVGNWLLCAVASCCFRVFEHEASKGRCYFMYSNNINVKFDYHKSEIKEITTKRLTVNLSV